MEIEGDDIDALLACSCGSLGIAIATERHLCDSMYDSQVIIDELFLFC